MVTSIVVPAANKLAPAAAAASLRPKSRSSIPRRLRELHREFLNAGSQVLQALTFFGTREKLNRAGYGSQVEEINAAAVKLAKEVAGDKALVAGSVSRTQLVEREGMDSLSKARDHIAEQIRLLKDAGVDFLILETFFHLAEMKVALAGSSGKRLVGGGHDEFSAAGHASAATATVLRNARVMADLGAIAVGANCEQDPQRMLPLLREMRSAAKVPLAAQPAAFRTTDACHSFTRLPEFPDGLESIQIPRQAFTEFGRVARSEGIGYAGGCCGCNAAYIRSLAQAVHVLSH